MKFEINLDIFHTDHTEFYLIRWIQMLPLYAAYSQSASVQTGYVDISLDDSAGPPGLAFCEYRPEYFLIPDCSFVRWRGYRNVGDVYLQNSLPLHERRPVAFWRGSTTGRVQNAALGWRSLQRVRLCEIAHDHPDLFDVGITAITQVASESVAAEVRGSGLMRDHVPASSFDKYMFQIDVDGNTNSWPGLFYKLLTGSPVLKIASPLGYRQWYYDKLKSWINYVPVTADMSDLVEKVRWLKAHEATARRIGDQGRSLADSLGYDVELRRAGRTITAALRHFARLPETTLRFGEGEIANECLREGWSSPEFDGVPAESIESRLELPRPIALDDYVVALEITPVPIDLLAVSQRLSVVANGEVLLQTRLSSRRELRCLLSRQTIDSAEELSIRLLHPDARTVASEERPLDGRSLSIVLHSLTITPVAIYASLPAAEPVAFPTELGHGVKKTHPMCELHPIDPHGLAGEIRTLQTHHGSIVYLHLATGELRHGQPGTVPRNVRIAVDNGQGYLLYYALSGDSFGIRVVPERAPAQASGPLLAFRLIEVGGSAFGVQSDGLFLCAEGDGRVSLSRANLGQWERFQLIDKGSSTD